MSPATETAAPAEHLAGDQVATSDDTPPQEAATSTDAGTATASAAAAEAAAAVLDSATNPAERDHIERDVSNILAGLNQEQLASIVAAARASEARNPDGSASGEGESFGQSAGARTYGLGQAASALTSIASGFKRTPGNDRTSLGTTATSKDLGDARPPPGTQYAEDEDDKLDAHTSAAIAAVKSATDTATAAAIASLGSLAASQSQPTQQDADESMDYDSPNGESASPGARGIKRPRGPELDRQRKDNHKEVERRRRSAINDGIVQLSHIVPGCDAKNTNKGAIIHAAVRYIQDLKHNEASNIEKWTLEKLLMDQAMGDLTAQLDEAQQQIERLRHELDERYAAEDAGQGKA